MGTRSAAVTTMIPSGFPERAITELPPGESTMTAQGAGPAKCCNGVGECVARFLLGLRRFARELLKSVAKLDGLAVVGLVAVEFLHPVLRLVIGGEGAANFGVGGGVHFLEDPLHGCRFLTSRSSSQSRYQSGGFCRRLERVYGSAGKEIARSRRRIVWAI